MEDDNHGELSRNSMIVELDHTQRQVAVSVKISYNTVNEVYRLADEKGLSCPLPSEWSNGSIHPRLMMHFNLIREEK